MYVMYRNGIDSRSINLAETHTQSPSNGMYDSVSKDRAPDTENLSKREQIKADRAELRRKVREESHSRKLERHEQSRSRYKESVTALKEFEEKNVSEE